MNEFFKEDIPIVVLATLLVAVSVFLICAKKETTRLKATLAQVQARQNALYCEKTVAQNLRDEVFYPQVIEEYNLCLENVDEY